ncbi:hypothetical protein [Corynebacterium sp. CNJ-954]|nr:hypothetical protein [Corynebacterium sp. CNJ-954]
MIETIQEIIGVIAKAIESVFTTIVGSINGGAPTPGNGGAGETEIPA